MASTLDSSRNASELDASEPKTADRNKTTTICFIWMAIFHPDREFFSPGRAAARSDFPVPRPHPIQNEAREPFAGSNGGPVRDANNAVHARDRPTLPSGPSRHP